MKVVEVKELSVYFGDFCAVNNISFEVNKGEIFGFLGANGAGKTTTIRVLCGLTLPTHGEVKVAGYDVSLEATLVKSKIGYMSQKFTLYNDLTVEENLEFASKLRKIPKNDFIKRRDEILYFIDFKKPLKTMVKNLPDGIKQQVALASSILGDPEVIFLDEPTAGVTPVSRKLFWDLIKNLSNQGKTIFVTTHYMDEAEYCGRIALMRSGEIIALSTADGLRKKAFGDNIDVKKISLDDVFIKLVEGTNR